MNLVPDQTPPVPVVLHGDVLDDEVAFPELLMSRHLQTVVTRTLLVVVVSAVQSKTVLVLGSNRSTYRSTSEPPGVAL